MVGPIGAQVMVSYIGKGQWVSFIQPNKDSSDGSPFLADPFPRPLLHCPNSLKPNPYFLQRTML